VAGFGAGCSTDRAGTPHVTTAPVPATSVPAATTPAAVGTWRVTPDGTISPATPWGWTGAVLLVAGGGCCDDVGTVDLAAFNPRSDTWSRLPPPPLTPRGHAAGIWTGTEMLVAGGRASPAGTMHDAVPATDGAAWNPATDSWHAISPMPLPSNSPESFWSGTEMLVWSSSPAEGSSPAAESVLAYSPTADQWRTLPPSGLAPRTGAVTVWAGNQLFVWGGLDGAGNPFGDGARLDPATGTWNRLPVAPVPARGLAAAVWTGIQVLIWGGQSGPGTQVGQGVAYTPAKCTWTVLPTAPPYPSTALFGTAASDGSVTHRAGAIGVWTGSEVLVVGGYNCCSQGNVPGGTAWTPSTGRT
jgi:hypothetical protein